MLHSASAILFLNGFQTQTGKGILLGSLKTPQVLLMTYSVNSGKLLCVSVFPSVNWSCNNGRWMRVKKKVLEMIG